MGTGSRTAALALGVFALVAPLAVSAGAARAGAVEAGRVALGFAPAGDATLTDGAGAPAAILAAAGGHTFSTGELTGNRFSSLGLSWRRGTPGAGVPDFRAEVRMRRGGVREEWRSLPLELEEGAAEEASRAGAPAFYAGRAGAADGVELRFTSPSGLLPRDLRLSFIDPARADAVLPRPFGEVSAPAIAARADWGADESLADPGLKTQSSLRAVLVHHTVTGNNGYAREQVPDIINGIYVHHIKDLGYGDFPYHFVVDRFGGVWEGRTGSVEMRPGGAVPAILGGHAAGFNSGTFSVALLGNFEPDNSADGEDSGPDPEPTRAMLRSVAELLAWKLGQYGLDPLGTTRLTSTGGAGTNPHAAGEGLAVPVIAGHRDVNATACPGGRLYAALPRLRGAVARRTYLGALD
ncbi:N-acetylmuramoyl-L-alanine amidase [Streptomyces sp. NPDC060031]|uniref:N-acetylmuramoyl-L-alanine amidase n=1 Tax=Streptomyces sp. NPDC060031 TaxID=3347043 RepID=UPI0036C469C8